MSPTSSETNATRVFSWPINGYPPFTLGPFDRSRVRLFIAGDVGMVGEGHCPYCRGRLDDGVCWDCGQGFLMVTGLGDAEAEAMLATRIERAAATGAARRQGEGADGDGPRTRCSNA